VTTLHIVIWPVASLFLFHIVQDVTKVLMKNCRLSLFPCNIIISGDFSFEIICYKLLLVASQLASLWVFFFFSWLIVLLQHSDEGGRSKCEQD
jgi:Zn-dependent membrane protease YugP